MSIPVIKRVQPNAIKQDCVVTLNREHTNPCIVVMLLLHVHKGSDLNLADRSAIFYSVPL